MDDDKPTPKQDPEEIVDGASTATSEPVKENQEQSPPVMTESLEPPDQAAESHQSETVTGNVHSKSRILMLILLILLVVGGALAWVWFALGDDANTNQDTNQATATISSYEDCVDAGYPVAESYPEQCSVPGGETFTRELSEDEKKETSIPDGYIEYNNEELGFSFAYPEEWGEVSLSERSGLPAIVGSEYQIKFSNVSTIKAEVDTTDYKNTGGVGSGYSYSGPGFTDYGREVNSLEDGQYLQVLDNKSDYVVFEKLDCVDITYVLLSLIPFDDNKLAGIGFGYSKDLQGTGACTDQESDSVSKYHETITQAQFTNVAKTVKQL
ncbi:MAG TPA: hypothetical protein VGA08_00060 [Candidatus Saccharimonadales bacterium]